MKKYIKYLAQKPGIRIVSLIILILLTSTFYLTMLSAREMKRIISEDFNNQQLALARHCSGILSNNVQTLKRELITLGLSPRIQYVDTGSWANRMIISLSSISDYGVIKILLTDANGTVSYSVDYTDTVFEEKGSYEDLDYFEWCKKPENRNRVYMSAAKNGVVTNSEPGLIMMMAVPVYQVSSNEAHPIPTQQFSGILAFVVDVGLLVEEIVSPVRSGKTGYAWVIDGSGTFMYHMEKDFIGQNAFEIRKFKAPHISFGKINIIQKTMMLQGKEGTSLYTSGWHRGLTGSMKKLIAYAPVYIGAANTKWIWSVAVVAPVSEVQDAVHGVYFRQSLIQGAFTVAVIIVLAFFISNETAWRRTLEQEVKEKTRDLENYALKLRRSEEKYRFLVESADDLIYMIDRDCNALSINKYSSKLIGCRSDDIIGKNISDFLKCEGDDDICSIVERICETSDSVQREERVTINNKEHWLDSKYKPVGTDQDEVTAVLVISRDITEHKTMEDQLFHTEKLASLGSLSAGVAHEINNPIAIILGFTELLLGRFAEDSKEYEILKTIERQGNNCKRIVENLLAFSRIPKKCTLETHVADNIQKVVNVVVNTLVTKKVDLKTDIEEDLPQVRGDGQQLEQVFLNIINNAVAAMDGGGILTISAHRSEDMVSIDFRDTGHGISPDDMDKIFEPFFTTKKVGEGTGLGLSVSYGIVKKFGGDIRVKSQTGEDGKEPGTTFSVLLAVADGQNRKSVEPVGLLAY
ncbi:MAG: hypothetical protein BA861_04075 [Desulfobacterales bacterium S3730MH5]|nr:MAG: hypothetical protein BA861_04075 [Desulfobacterales bacterium S3730MH5]